MTAPTSRTVLSVPPARVAALSVALCLAAVACAPPPATDPGPSARLAATNALIIDGTGGPPVADGVVVVEGGRIVAAGPAAEVAVPGDATIVDAAGGAVLPGLADMHVHMVGGWDGISTDMLGYRRYLNGLLHAGVTTVFDAGNVLPFIQQIRAEVEAGRLRGPRIYMAGPLVDGPVPIWPPITYSTFEPSAMRRHAAQLAAAGVDALKGYAGLDREMVDSLVRAGAEFGLPVVVDLGSRGDYAAAVESGVAARAHAPSGPLSDDEIAAMVEHGTATITTLAVLESFARRRLRDLAFLDHPLVAATTPPRFLEALREHASRALSEAEIQRAAAVQERLMVAMANLKRLHEAGVLVVAGTDAPYPGVFQGEGVHRELELLVEAGFTPIEAIAAASHNAARLMGAEHEWGVIAPGMAADLVVVRGNPAVDIGATRDIVAVIQAGVVLDRTALEVVHALGSQLRLGLPDARRATSEREFPPHDDGNRDQRFPVVDPGGIPLGRKEVRADRHVGEQEPAASRRNAEAHTTTDREACSRILDPATRSQDCHIVSSSLMHQESGPTQKRDPRRRWAV